MPKKSAKRTNITVPAELYERIKNCPGPINVSKVCAEALDTFVSRVEMEAADKMGIQAAILRLKASKTDYAEQHTNEAYRLGFRDGFAWGRDEASYNALVKQVQIREKDDPADLVGKHVLPNSERLKFEKYSKEHSRSYLEYLRGWYDGLMELWIAVKDEVGEDN